MTHPHLHNLTALAAVADFARIHTLPLDTIALPSSPHGHPDLITVDVPWGAEAFDAWVQALGVEIHREEVLTPGAALTLRLLASYAVPGTSYEQAKLYATLPDVGVKVLVVARWRLEPGQEV